jgi:hypothetical protein
VWPSAVTLASWPQEAKIKRCGCGNKASSRQIMNLSRSTS